MRASLTISRLYVVLAALPLVGCVCGEPLVVNDVFVPPEDRSAAPGSLHTYATNARIGLEVRPASDFLAIEDVTVAAGGGLTIDDENPPEIDAGTLKLAALTGGAGDGTLTFTGADGALLTERTLTVVEADAIALSVTAPGAPGIELPDVDPANLRIFAGGAPGFRATLTAGDVEIFGFEALTVTPADESAGITSRQGTACAAGDCAQPRNAVVLSVPAALADPVDVELASGAASLTVNVVPTAVDAVDALVSDPRDTSDLAEGDDVGVLVHALAGTEPVFGAPIAWTIDGAAVEGTGDVLQVPFVSGAAVAAEATLGTLTAAASVEGTAEGAKVTSMNAVCGAGAGAPLVIALVAFARARRRQSTRA